MKVHVQRQSAGQTRIGLFSNLWPTRVCSVDRLALRVWYIDLHIWPFYIWFTGNWKGETS